MDSLRHWVSEMHVDGFRFDLASTLARKDCTRSTGCRRSSTSSSRIRRSIPGQADRRTVGRRCEAATRSATSLPQWTEWNGMYRDRLRDYWRGPTRPVSASSGYRITGSSDLYEDDGRRPHASINFITADDGFTLARSRSPTTTSTTTRTARTTATVRTTTDRGTAAPRADRRPGRNGLRARQQRNLLASYCFARHPDAPAATVRSDASGATTTPSARTRPVLVRLG